MPTKLLLPEKTAVTTWAPCVIEEVENIAVPPLRGTLPRGPVRLSLKLTEPVGLTLLCPGNGEATTVAVNVTGLPEVEGFELEVSVTLLAPILKNVVRPQYPTLSVTASSAPSPLTSTSTRSKAASLMKNSTGV